MKIKGTKYVRLAEDISDRLDRFGAAFGMSRAEAADFFLRMAMQTVHKSCEGELQALATPRRRSATRRRRPSSTPARGSGGRFLPNGSSTLLLGS